MPYKFSYRIRLILAIAALSVMLSTLCIVFYYRYTYNTVIDSISKNLKDIAGIYRASLDEGDLERIGRLRTKVESQIHYSKADLKYLEDGGIKNFLPKKTIDKLQSDPDFVYLDNKLEKMMMVSIQPSSPREAVFDNNKLFEYPERGLVGVCIIFSAEKYAEHHIVQTMISTAYRPVGKWPGNSTGTSWRTPDPKSVSSHYEIFGPTDLYQDKFYTSLYATCPIVDLKGRVLGYFEVDYPAGNELYKLSQLRILSYALAVISLFLGVIVALIVSGRMSRSLKKLISSANRIKNNDYTSKVDIPKQDEFGVLGNAFNSMADAINATTIGLSENNERLRSLTADMHDGVGAVLASMKIASANGNMDNIGSLADQGMGEIRFLMDAIEYDKCTFELLTEGVTLMAVDILQPNRVKWGLVTDGDEETEIPFRMYLDVQRIAREAFTNIIKHSESAMCHIKLVIIDNELRLNIENMGKLLEKPRTVSGGRGLQNMRYRIKRYGGSMAAEPTEEGFMVSVKICIQSA